MLDASLIHTAKTRATGGREKGVVRSSDGRLAVRLSMLNGAEAGTNPEQLFAAGWSACFESAMGRAARKMRITLPDDLAIDAEVDLFLGEKEGYFLRGRLTINLPGIASEIALKVADAAHQTCPYSKAIRGNVDVSIKVL
ncbi:MAG: organic hydroperoxide resistance protein [Nevskia sp.]|nr:organic hydroperoxide resistance protein [Nevskia sp.]